ncbi:MAG: translation elongation factor Ts [Rubrobacteraceae bacterium]
MATNIQNIKQLREETGAGMMDVKKALDESGDEVEEARRILRERGQAAAEKKSAREASEGLIESYIHFNGRVGVLIEVNCETDFVARTPEFKEFARNLALHVASMNPITVSVEDIPDDVLQEEREIAEKQAAELGKPENVTRQIVEGRMKKRTSEMALLTQDYVKEPDKTVEDLLKETVQKVGENVVIRRFVRYAL